MIGTLKRELTRLRGELVALSVTILIFFFAGISRANFEVIIFKIGVIALASIVSHIFRQLVFDYICLEECIFGEERFAQVPASVRAAVTIGVFFVYAAIVYCVAVSA